MPRRCITYSGADQIGAQQRYLSWLLKANALLVYALEDIRVGELGWQFQS